MKKITLILALMLIVSLFSGCAGTPVIYYTNCTCPPSAHDSAAETQPVPAGTEAPAENAGALKTGLVILGDLSGSKDAAADQAGEAKYDVTMVAVLVDDEGIIHDCVIDSVSTSVQFDAAGVIVTDLTAAPSTKNELGDAYNMVAYGGAVAEWYQQAAAVAAACVGNRYSALQGVVVSESGYAPEGTDLATSATIYIGGLVKAVEQAAASAQHLGAQSGDVLKLAVINGIDGSASASSEAAGTAQLDVNAAAVTFNGQTVTSCCIDALQAKVSFDSTGVITSDILTAPATKNQLGEKYGMVAWGGAIAEWNVQAASFAAYVTGKTPDEIAGIAVDESAHPTDADLATSVTISIGGFQALIEKAAR